MSSNNQTLTGQTGKVEQGNQQSTTIPARMICNDSWVKFESNGTIHQLTKICSETANDRTVLILYVPPFKVEHDAKTDHDDRKQCNRTAGQHYACRLGGRRKSGEIDAVHVCVRHARSKEKKKKERKPETVLVLCQATGALQLFYPWPFRAFYAYWLPVCVSPSCKVHIKSFCTAKTTLISMPLENACACVHLIVWPMFATSFRKRNVFSKAGRDTLVVIKNACVRVDHVLVYLAGQKPSSTKLVRCEFKAHAQ